MIFPRREVVHRNLPTLMYCRNCGKVVAGQAVMCISCGSHQRRLRTFVKIVELKPMGLHRDAPGVV
jgi:uncharacterized OB-fold protein